jgi:hypothetical protein
MRRRLWTGWLGALLFVGGCATGPLQDNPVLVRPAAPPCAVDNPVFVPLPSDSEAYACLFARVLDVVDDYFEIAYSNRYDGRVETYPKIAPGVGQPWKPGSPDCYQRLLASFQTIRLRAVVVISPAAAGGYFIDVKVYRELEDLARPTRATAGGAAFRSEPTLERQFEVIEPDLLDVNWIPVGRDTALEQALLDRLAHFDPRAIKNCP